ncbi:DUF4129 domain-containing protein [Streptomyces sp. NBC_00378]|uniref:DUF4129 domain-containing protein n=1 Tax=unclassified Streptomyces TaxID=2593676 RepID=UPI00225555C7|nr:MULTISPECIES: DUF4129 domain-containing protein [unclassified Streptomyces]MCX5113477.1 DUF4129 domain-containing protein [Streptomyces sp. NBC_00378]
MGGAALGALLLHPGTGLFVKGRGPLGGNPVLVVGLALLSLLGGFALRGKYLEQIGVGKELNPVEQRLVDSVSRVLLAAPLVLPLLILVLHRFGSSASSPGAGHGPFPFPSARQDPVRTPPPTPDAEHSSQSAHFGLMRILLGLGIVLLAVAVVLAGLHLWRYLTRPPEPAAATTYATLDDEQERLAQAVDSGRRALLDGTDTRAAVIACYVAMEESLAESGVARRASDSPQDLLERAAAVGLPARAATADLTALFREARYSTHPMDGGHRDRAAAALAEIAEIAEIADGLRSRESAPEAVAGAS